MSPLPLAGIRILSVEQYGAGPWATMFLGDLGAEVIKVEHPDGGDIGRRVPPYTVEGDSLYFQSLNRNKRSIGLDLKSRAGRDIFDRLVPGADAVFNNLRGDLPARMELDYEHLKALKPSIVCCSLSGYGRTGPHAAEPAYDYLMQGLAGWMDITGEPGGPPQKSGLSLVDLSAGVMASLGLVSAILCARETGQGADVDVSLFDTALSELSYVACWTLNAGYEPVRLADSSHPSQVPSQILPTKDGWLVVMCAKEKFFERLVEALGVPELATDARYRTFEGRLEHREELVARLKERTLLRPTSDWLQLLRGQVPCAPVRSVRQALSDPEIADSDRILHVPHPSFGTVRQVSSPIRINGATRSPTAAPPLGADTEALLSEELGLSAASIKRLRESGAVR